MIEVFCGLDLKDAFKMKATDVYRITAILGEMFEQKPKLVQRFTMDGVEYGFIPNLDDMSLGEYIDLDTHLSDWQNMHLAMAVLYRPIKQKLKHKYLIKDYEAKDQEKMKNMPMDAVLSSMLFLPFRNRLVSSYDELFGAGGGQDYSPAGQFGAKWGWYSSIYALAQGNIRRFEHITKLNVHQCLNFLAFMKDKAEAESKQLKTKLR